MPITPSKLREDVYNILDSVLEKGEVVEVRRKGQIVRIVPPQKKNKLDRLVAHPDTLTGQTEDIANEDWSSGWKPFI